MSVYPVMLDGGSLRALVVGGGAVATRKARALLASGATVRVVAPRIDAAMRSAAPARLTIEEREYRSSDIGDEMLVIAATDSRRVNARVASDARARGRLVNVADAPAEGNCSTPAVHRAGDLVVAVTAGGVPGIATRIRDCIADRFGAPYAAAVRQLADAREAKLRAGDRGGWRRMVESLVADDFCEAVERNAFAERVAQWR